MNTIVKKVLVSALTLILFLSMLLLIRTHHTVSAQGSETGKIVFDTFRDGNQEIYVMDPDGANPTNLTNNTAGEYFSTWSPDSTQIAFGSQRDGNWEIYVMDSDGANPTRLTNNAAYDANPSWSPDGAQIAFMSNRDGNWEVYVMNADGTNPTNLTNHSADDGGPAWSPNGTQIAFSSTRDGNNEIYVMDADGSNSISLTNDVANDILPRWSPDGTQIGFSTNRDGNQEIYIIRADGSNPTNLTNNAADDAYSSWSPDGTQIAFQSYRDGNWEIYVMNADGSNQTRLTNHPAIDQYPDWQGNIHTAGCSIKTPSTVFQGDIFTLTLGCEDVSGNVFGFQAGHSITVGNTLVSAQATSYIAGSVFEGQQTLAGPNTLPLYALSLQAGGIQATGDFTLGSVEYVAVVPGQVTFDIMHLILGDIDGNAIPNAATSTTTATITINDLILSLMGIIDPQGYAHANQLTFTLDGSPVYANLTPTYNATTGNTTFTYTNIKGHPASLTVDAPSHVACVESLTFPIDAGNETLPNTLILRAGDVNGDNRVNITDAAAIGQGYGLQPTGELDINHDGAINILDLIHVGRNYGIAQATDCMP